MKILVPVKRVVDKDIKIRVKADGSGVELANVKMSMNPFDEIAVEEALRLKEKGQASEVVCVSIGPAQATETIRTGLAMGADRGILVKTDKPVEPLAVAKILNAILAQEHADRIERIEEKVRLEPSAQCLELRPAKRRLQPRKCRASHSGRSRAGRRPLPSIR